MIPEVSVVCPCYNEEANVEAIAAAVTAELERAGATFEFIFIDNASTDRTVQIVRALCARDRRIKLIVNTRNFGQMRSPTHAIYQTSGRAVLGIVADFQDPPELIGPMLALWRGGAPIVLGTRAQEQSSWLHARIRALGYALFVRFGDVPIVPGATGFGIYDQRVIQVLKRWNEPEPFFRAMLVESGFPIVTVPHARGRRSRGKSSNSWPRLVNFAVSGVAGSAKRLLRLPIFIGAGLFALVALMLIAAALGAALGWHVGGLLWASLIEANVALLLGFLGLIGDQIRLIAERTRHTPLVIEKERINF